MAHDDIGKKRQIAGRASGVRYEPMLGCGLTTHSDLALYKDVILCKPSSIYVVPHRDHHGVPGAILDGSGIQSQASSCFFRCHP